MRGTMRAFYSDRECGYIRCEVLVNEKDITASYIGEQEQETVYTGTKIGDGRFQLQCQQRPGRATFHRWPDDSAVLEGRWYEGHEEGMWLIELEDD